MLLKFAGTTRRIIGPYTWSRENNWVTSVDDPALAAELITNPRERFSIADEEPLSQISGKYDASALLLEGINNLEALAAVKAPEARKVAKRAGVEYSVVRTWIDAARNEINAAPGQETEGESDVIDGG